MLEEIIGLIIGGDEFIAATGVFLDGLGHLYEGEAAIAEVPATYLEVGANYIDVLKGEQEVLQTWDPEAGAWVNEEQVFNQPVFPWDPAARPAPSGPEDPNFTPPPIDFFIPLG
jgi:hypothetical protein